MASTTAPLYTQPSAHLRGDGVATLLRAILRIPLIYKVMGANAIIVAVAIGFVSNGLWGDSQGQLVIVLAALAAACVVNLLLVRLALSPLGELARLAGRVSSGEFGARATPSLVADPQLATLTDTINSLLDSLAAERRRIQKLGKEVISAQDTERAKVARELHDSIAQTLAAVGFQLSAAGAATEDHDLRNTLAAARGTPRRIANPPSNSTVTTTAAHISGSGSPSFPMMSAVPSRPKTKSFCAPCIRNTSPTAIRSGSIPHVANREPA